jgi:16S rRNA (cytidine1402-2'-O)-methyltransferase
LLAELSDTLGGERQAAVCRELTKRFEEVARGTIAELARDFAARSVKGEIVVVIDRPRAAVIQPAEVEARLKEALECHSIRDAATEVSQALGLPRRQVYQMALRLAAGG